MPISIEDELKARLEKYVSAPFLFVGSGLSRRYYGLPNWENLLKQLCEAIGVNYDEIYSLVDGDLPKAATILSDRLHPIWWNDEKFSNSRNTYASLARSHREYALKIEAAILISSRNTLDIEYSDEIAELRKVVIDGIITTNYDLLIENIFGDDMKAFVGQQSMLKSPLHRIGEIYKIHGSVDDPTSLVLTDSDYLNFDQKNYYLAAILTQIFVEHPIIFLGYSISDKNIQKILTNVVLCLDEELVAKLSDRLIFIERLSEGQSESITSSVMYFLDGRIQLPITKISTNNFSSIYKALQNFKRGISPKILRLFKETAHDIALQHSPESKLLLSDMDPTAHKNLEFIFGHGVMAKSGIKGALGIERDDIVKNLLGVDTTYSSEQIMIALIKLTRNAGIYPLGKYLIDTKRAVFKNNRWEIEVPDACIDKQRERLETYFRNDFDYYRANRPSKQSLAIFRAEVKSVNDVTALLGNNVEALRRISWLDAGNIDLDDLRDYLISIVDIDKGSQSTNYYKLVAFYDFMKNIHQKKKPKKAILIN